MQRDVKVGIAIGVLLIAVIAVFWWTKQSSRPTPPAETKEFTTEPALPPAVEPALPPGPVGVTPMPATTGGATPATPGGPAAPAMPGSATATPTPTPGRAGAPETMPGAAPPAAPEVAKKTYKIQTGDTLATIAGKFYNDQGKWQTIYNANKAAIGSDPNRLKVGVELVIPDLGASSAMASTKTGAAPATAAGAQKHVVATGETLSSIAKKYYGSDSKANTDRIYAANKAKIGSDPDDIKVGMELVIPPAH